ncbi:MAG: hypothetical protein HY774_24910 [Acidobacteria bacterium]|nr:hypothetical protein [Acidobacteriota bacterium]
MLAFPSQVEGQGRPGRGGGRPHPPFGDGPGRGDRDRPNRGDDQRHRDKPRPGRGMGRYFAEMRFDGKVVTGAPYSAQIVTRNIQTLRDGTKLTNESTAKVFRDTQGRIRREQALPPLGPFGPDEPAEPMIFIYDPVAEKNMMLDPSTGTAWKIKQVAERMPPPPRDGNVEEKTEPLGKKTLEGVEVEGTRSVITIPVGQIGNDRPIEIVSEKWFSPVLQIVISSRHIDPRVGEFTYQVTNLRLEEPEKSLFKIPATYTRLKDKDADRLPRPERQREPEEPF